MPWNNTPDFWNLLAALFISTVSGIVSISRRILAGQKYTCLWILSEYLSAILFGYIAYHIHPILEPNLPYWVTSPLLIAFAAHSGGDIFKHLEHRLFRHFGVEKREKNK